MSPLIDTLLSSPEPSIRFKVRTGVLGEAPDSPGILALREDIRRSPRVQALLDGRDAQGRLSPVGHVYAKWNGAHWVLAALADLGYPTGDPDLLPIRDQVLETWLAPQYLKTQVCETSAAAYKSKVVPVVRGKARRCASQQSNALFATLALGLMDERCDQLADLLIGWQWPDGGWNCDRRPEADNSSFWESLLPLRALALYARVSGSPRAAQSAERAAEVFLQRRLFRRLSDGEVMNPQFLLLHYPSYWRYDILIALKVMAEAGFINDPRCAEALDLLEAKQLPGGGWPAEERLYKFNPKAGSYERVDWGGASKGKMNEWVTADALAVLVKAGRITR